MSLRPCVYCQCNTTNPNGFCSDACYEDHKAESDMEAGTDFWENSEAHWDDGLGEPDDLYPESDYDLYAGCNDYSDYDVDLPW
jgi:hypothetical protein